MRSPKNRKATSSKALFVESYKDESLGNKLHTDLELSPDVTRYKAARGN